jgi:hypothetical protein
MKVSANKNVFAAIATVVSWARRPQLLACVLLSVTTIALAGPRPLHRHQSHVDSGLAAHEWGTFTAIAGSDGRPVEWLPVQFPGPPELPGFVEHFKSAVGKALLSGRVRMETPVIYFYAAHETSVSVHVSFAKGLITEWYPHASHLQPSTPLTISALSEPHEDGSIAWDAITVAPNLADDFPRENAGSHYYAARETSATPLSVQGPSGDQHEKFLFYRGISNVALPLSAKVLPSGSVQFDNRTAQPIPALILFERRGDKFGYHIVTSPQSHAILETPSVSGTFDSLRGDLEDLLVTQGLFRDEAHAMLETWRDSWFEEGSRLFYIVPRGYLDSILPLSITPVPTQLVRVFVGRIEVVTPSTQRSVETALASRDRATLKKYGRFLDPILGILAAKQSDPARAARLFDDLSAAYQQPD